MALIWADVSAQSKAGSMAPLTVRQWVAWTAVQKEGHSGRLLERPRETGLAVQWAAHLAVQMVRGWVDAWASR